MMLAIGISMFAMRIMASWRPVLVNQKVLVKFLVLSYLGISRDGTNNCKHNQKPISAPFKQRIRTNKKACHEHNETIY